jgi:hypothetical protein
MGPAMASAGLNPPTKVHNILRKGIAEMKKILDWIIDRQLKAILPGDSKWPPYARSKSMIFWDNWRNHCPLSTKLALVGGSALIFLYCIMAGMFMKGCGTLEKQLETGLGSNIYIVRQSVILLKLVASMAYFTDPKMQEMARAHGVK